MEILYKLDELMEGSAFEQFYDAAIAEGCSHIEAVERASSVTEELTTQKILGYALLVKNYEAEIEALSIEARKMQDRAKVKANKIEALKQRLEMFLPHDFRLEDARAVVSFRKNAPSVLVEDESVIPQEFKKEIPASWQLVKAELLKALKAGDKVQGASLVTGKMSIQIK